MGKFVRDTEGFSLIWVSVAVAVIGIVIASSLPGGKLADTAKINAVTLERMQKIEEATRAFMAANHRRPCPADGTLAPTDANFGLEAYSVQKSVTLNGTQSVISTSDVVGVEDDALVTGTGIPSGTRIINLNSITNEIYIDHSATISGPTTLTFTGSCGRGDATTPNFNSMEYIGGDLVAGTPEVQLNGPGNGNIWSPTFIGDYAVGNRIPIGTRLQSIEADDRITLDNSPTASHVTQRIGLYRGVAGTVPTRTLGLPDEYGLDGYGRRFMYVVDKKATRADMCRDLQANGEGGSIRIVKSAPAWDRGDTHSSTSVTGLQPWLTTGVHVGDLAYGPGIVPGTRVAAVTPLDTSLTLDQATTESNAAQLISFVPPATDQVMWALVSYGKDGHGAFPEEGSAIAKRVNNGTVGHDTQNNALVFYDFTVNNMGTRMLVKREAGLDQMGFGFDDTVWYLDATKNSCCMGKTCQLSSEAQLTNTASEENYLINGIATGDVNGDNIPDIAITVNNGVNKQRTYVIFGTKRGWAVPIGPAGIYLDGTALDGTNGFVVNHAGSRGVTARNIAIGDVNGDGKDDLVIPYNTGGYAVVFGSTTLGSTGAITMNDGWLATGNGMGGTYGTKITTQATSNQTVALGDVDGDGTKDIIFAGSSGNAYIVLGGATLNVATVGVNTTITGSSGYGLAVGDVNGDDKDDITLQGGGGATGTAYMLFGRGAWAASVDATDVTDPMAAKALALNIYNNAETATATISDLNKDGKKDLIIPNGSGIRIYYGKAASGGEAWPNPTHMDNAHITSDGTAPLLANEGSMVVGGAVGIKVYFAPSTTYDLATWNLDGSDGFTITNGSTPYTNTLYYPALADVNGDGLGDAVVAISGDATSKSTPVRLYAISGRYKTGWEATFDLGYMP